MAFDEPGSMKRGGIALVVLLAISGLLRVAGPPSSSSGDSTSGTLAPGKSTAAQKDQQGSRSPYQTALHRTIQDFFGYWPGDSDKEESESHLDVPECARSQIKFVVAILPDPVHTHLSLFFDRNVEALQQAAQKKQYGFDRAILPWQHSPPSDSADAATRQTNSNEQIERESNPGLLIFRDGTQDAKKPASSPASPQPVAACFVGDHPLFVFVVGETPTGGVRKKQFHTALDFIRRIQAPDAPFRSPLLILGPSFSGSLDSLAGLLNEEAIHHALAAAFVYSGTITGQAAAQRFRDVLMPHFDAHFASFLENDAYSLKAFLAFARSQGYASSDIAVLSEDATEFGAPRKPSDSSADSDDTLRLHFPREISYFRSAYQKQAVSQPQPTRTPGRSTLPLDLNESGENDDAVAPFAVVQTPLSQEAVMLGVVSELQKHHTKFTVLMASDPVDQLFLARYLRTDYPQGRVVVTAPDLLFSREEDSLLHGVLGLNTYSLLPGMSDRLGRYSNPSATDLPNGALEPHEDRLFVSSLSVGEFNAMLALLSVPQPPTGTSAQSDWDSASKVPWAPYVEYAPPVGTCPSQRINPDSLPHRPLLWLTMLGRDGYWPIVALTADLLVCPDREEPVVRIDMSKETSTLLPVHARLSAPGGTAVNRMPPDWQLTYCLFLMLLAIHVFFSATGSILANSDASSQFAYTLEDYRGSLIIAVGGLSSAAAFLLVLLSRDPMAHWQGGEVLAVILWLPYPAFIAMTFRDLLRRRPALPEGPSSAPGKPLEPLGRQRQKVLFERRRCLWIARGFLVLAVVITVIEVYLALFQPRGWGVHWSRRMPHFASGVSPILPLLLLLAGGYWWMWMSLRGVAIVDLRRPRLPDPSQLPLVYRSISETAGEELRSIAHPCSLRGRILVPVAAFGVALFALLNLRGARPIQTIEGKGYDWVFMILLGALTATLLGCLARLVSAWLMCRQILGGLDRVALRDAFGRMKELSWHSFWMPGGSSLEETYKMMSRSLENLRRLKPMIEDPDSSLECSVRQIVGGEMNSAFQARNDVVESYRHLLPAGSGTTEGQKEAVPEAASFFRRAKDQLRRNLGGAPEHTALIGKLEALQMQLAKTAAVLIREVLPGWWDEQDAPVVSEDEHFIERKKLPPVRVLAEEFVALVYVNFLVSVLLRMRTIVICACGLYVFIVLALNVYPFEPHPALQAMTVILLVAMGASIGYVYAGMHRDAILSRLTTTHAGELGWDFWLKFGAAGAIPVFSLLAAQFPSINQFLFNWLEPALHAVK